MAYITPASISLASLDPSYVSASSTGDSFVTSDRTFFHVKNDSASSVTATVIDWHSTGPSNADSFNPNVSVVIEPSGERFLGPFGPARFGDDTSGNASVTYSSAASVTVAVFSLSSVAT